MSSSKPWNSSLESISSTPSESAHPFPGKRNSQAVESDHYAENKVPVPTYFLKLASENMPYTVQSLPKYCYVRYARFNCKCCGEFFEKVDEWIWIDPTSCPDCGVPAERIKIVGRCPGALNLW